jgi:hypothetical protein
MSVGEARRTAPQGVAEHAHDVPRLWGVFFIPPSRGGSLSSRLQRAEGWPSSSSP